LTDPIIVHVLNQ